MKIKFIGVPGEDHVSMKSYGITFPKDKEVEVHDPVAMRKLRGHPHFKVTEDVTDVVAKDIKKQSTPQEQKAEVMAKLAGKVSRADLESLAAAVGVRADGRWSDERLREEIEKAA